VPDEVLDDARARLDVDHRSLDALLERLDAERAEAEALRADLEGRVADVEAREQALGARETELDDAERSARKEREEARAALLMEARTLVEEKIAELDARFEAADRDERAAASREARRAVEAGIREAREAASEADAPSRAPLPGGDDPEPGDRVAWHGSNRDGVLVEVRGDRAVVEVDGIRLTVPRTDLEPVVGERRGGRAEVGGARAGVAAPGRTERRERIPEIEVRTELDLRGLRVEELDGVLIPAVDAAVVADLPWLRIIHGKGTGALRQRVQAMLDEDPRVRAHRPGAPNEGGTGVTVAEFQ
jgi:DNA mismatch repair protein MutS2